MKTDLVSEGFVNFAIRHYYLSLLFSLLSLRTFVFSTKKVECNLYKMCDVLSYFFVRL